MYTRVSRETCLRETGRAPIKTGWGGDGQGTTKTGPTFAPRWVAKEYKTHARPELLRVDAAVLEALLSEIATGENVDEKQWHVWRGVVPRISTKKSIR